MAGWWLLQQRVGAESMLQLLLVTGESYCGGRDASSMCAVRSSTWIATVVVFSLLSSSRSQTRQLAVLFMVPSKSAAVLNSSPPARRAAPMANCLHAVTLLSRPRCHCQCTAVALSSAATQPIVERESSRQQTAAPALRRCSEAAATAAAWRQQRQRQ
jgi:hypothetical protein